MSDLVSVIIPAYNHEQYVQETIRSIIGQTYKYIELLVIDDGSKDTTFERINEMKTECEKRFVRTVFITQENQGVGRTLNRMIDLAEGEYIFSSASDDLPKLHTIEKLHEFLSKNPDYIVALGDSEIINSQSERVYWSSNQKIVPKEQAAFMTFGDSFDLNNTKLNFEFGSYESLLNHNYLPNGQLLRKDALLKTGKYNPNIILEDWYMNLQLAKLGKMKYFPEILFSYRWHDNNTVSSVAYRQKVAQIYRQIYLNEKEYCFSYGYKKLWQKLWDKNAGWKYRLKQLRKSLFQFRWKKERKIIRLFGITLMDRAL